MEVFEFYTIFIALICFIYGSVPFAYIFTYLFQKVRLTQKGTGNIGVANAFGVGGLRVGFLTVIGEATKAALPVYLSFYLYSNDLRAAVIFLSASILGTSYSIFLKGKGSQGGTVFLWGLLFLSPYTFLLFIGMFLPVYLLLRKRHITSIVAHALLPLEIYLIEGDLSLVIFGALAALFYSLRYKPQASDYAYYNKDMRLLRFTKKIMREKEDQIIDVSKVSNQSQVGMKAWGLRQLEKIGLQIPKTYVCPFSVYTEYTNGNKELLSEIELNLNKLIKEGISYCIRSSANVEDKPDYSFAGQFESYLKIHSIDEIKNKILKIWQSPNSQRVNAYIRKIGIPLKFLKMAVVIQEMVPVKYSGVVFTKNPINGFDEVIVELVRGPSSLLLQDGVTPERWIYKWGIWKERPNDSRLDISIIDRVVREAKYAEKKFGSPVDMEWAYDGESLYWLQIRTITTARGISIYSNRISKGFLPGIIKPLVWTVNTEVVNSAWKNIFIELIGKDARDIDIHRLTKSFYGRAYFNMGIIGDIFELIDMPRELLELLLGFSIPGDSPPKFRPGIKAIKYLPRITLFIVR
ncbi:MAG: glycerol-3-phosphate acyltransferase, partial [Dehalococcoidia bacterium]